MGLRKRLKWLLGLGSLMIGIGLIGGLTSANADSGASGHTVWTSIELAPNHALLKVHGTAPTGSLINFTDSVPLFYNTGKVESVRRVARGFESVTDQILLNLDTGKSYYQINKTEYLDAADVDYTDPSGDTTTTTLTINCVNPANTSLQKLTFTVGTQQAAALMTELTTAKPAADITGYKLDTVAPAGTNEVTYTYDPTVTFKFQDASGNQLADDEVVSGKPGDKYTLPDKSTDAAFKGLTLKSVKGGTPTGVYQDTPQTFTYVYGKPTATSTGTNTAEAKAAPVTVHYQTASGTKLAKDTVINGTVNAPYQAKQKAVKGYTFVKTIGTPAGKFTTSAQTVTYVYTKNAVAFQPFMIYAKQGLYRYAKPTFKASQRVAHVKDLPRIKAKTFKVVGTTKSAQGRTRYQLADGTYVTAKTNFVANLYWQGKHYQKLVVFNPKGTYEYQQATFSHAKRVKHLKQGTVVHVKRLVRRGVMTRYQLTNGTYVTGNKQWVSVK
ncbi:MucBP domain-containing protein [Levilactobacillus yonginensis]